MGVFGSTRWNGIGTKNTLEGNRCLDINCLNRAGCLKQGYCGGWQWTRDGEPVASINLRRDCNLLHLSYRIRQDGGDWQDIEQPTLIAWTPYRLGGSRPYFVCPGVVNGPLAGAGC
jgi:hypothetical protein